MAPAACMIDVLSDDLLGSIFMHLPQRCRLCDVTLTCKRCARIMSQPSMWEIIEFHANVSDDKGETSASGLAALAWLQQRSSCTRRLVLTDRLMKCTEDDAAAAVYEDCLLRNAVQTVGAAPVLRELRVAFCCLNGGAMAHAGLLHGLTSLYMCFSIICPLRVEDLDTLFSGLPALESCHLDVELDEDAPDVQPAVFPPALLSCTRLTDLILMPLGEIFDFGGLPADIGHLRRLQRLHLGDCLGRRLTSELTALTALSSLRVCALHPSISVDGILPSNAACLTALRELRISSGENWSAGVAAIGTITGLRRLSLGEVDALPDSLSTFSCLCQLTHLELHACSAPCAETVMSLVARMPLRVLDVSFCGITNLPALPYLSRLTCLELMGNNFKAVPVALAAALQLQELDISRMKPAIEFKPEDAEIFRSLTRLITVRVQPAPGHDIFPKSMEALMRIQLACPQAVWRF